MSISIQNIKDACINGIVVASTTYTQDHRRAFEIAASKESDKKSKWVLEMLIENDDIAQNEKTPLCDDTGIPYVLIEIGENAQIEGNFANLVDAVNEGIADGLRALPARPMAVKGDDFERIVQSVGLYDDPGMVVPAPIRFKSVKGNKLKITILLLGGGPEIRARTYRIFHHHNLEKFTNEISEWAVEMAAKLGCTPCIPTIGVGRTHYEATCLMMDAMAEAQFGVENEFEKKITKAVNDSFTGSLGIGGSITALQTFAKIGPQRASGVRIVCLRMGCIVDPRRYIIELK